jgi:glutaredoxin
MLATVLMLVSASSVVEAGCSQRVYLYSASWCPSCREVRAILARNNIPYTLLDATTPRVQADMVARFGDTAVPRTLIGRSVVKGVDEALIKKLCARGLRRHLPNQSTISAFWDLDPWPVTLWQGSKSTSVHALPVLAQEVVP